MTPDAGHGDIGRRVGIARHSQSTRLISMKLALNALVRRLVRPFLGRRLGRLPVVRTLVGLYNRYLLPEYFIIEGQRLYLRPEEPGVSGALALNGAFEETETAALRDFVRPGMNVLDVGANIGYFTLLSSTLVGPNGLVLAVEPDEGNQRYLRRTVAQLRNSNVEIAQAAAWHTNGEIEFFLCAENSADHRVWADAQQPRPSVTVPARRLDDLIAGRRFDVMKIDVQGAEGHALRGMARTLAANPPRFVIMEFWPSGLRGAGSDPREVYRMLADVGYEIQMRGIGDDEAMVVQLDSYDPIEEYCDEDWKFVNLLCRLPDA